MRIKLVLNSLFLITVCLVYFSCSPSRNSQGQSGPSGLIHSYNKGLDSTLYFISSIKYKGNKKGAFEIDFTYLSTPAISDSVVCNFTLFTNNANFKPKSLEIPIQDKKFIVSNFEKFYAEAINSKKFKYRYSFTIYESIFNQWMNSSVNSVTLNTELFKPKSGYSKKVDAIKNKVLFDNF